MAKEPKLSKAAVKAIKGGALGRVAKENERRQNEAIKRVSAPPNSGRPGVFR